MWAYGFGLYRALFLEGLADSGALRFGVYGLGLWGLRFWGLKLSRVSGLGI